VKPTRHLANHIFQNHHVAALAWAIGSAPLMSNSGSNLLCKMLSEEWFTDQLELHWSLIIELDNDPQPLIKHIENDNPKLLGKYFESLISFWFYVSPHFELVAKNIKFKDNKLTTGEADLLVIDLYSGELRQIELACKYYLGLNNSSAHKNWIGPNGTDSLALKIDKLERQTSVFYTKPGYLFLNQNNLKQPEVKIIMKGFFFHHYKVIASNKTPYSADIHYNSGWFIHINEIDALFGSLEQWVVLPKFLWPCLYNFQEGTETILNGEQMIKKCKEEISKNKRAILIAQVVVLEGSVREISRGFVITDKWPNGSDSSM